MCRLFGFRSGVANKVHRTLVRESNALRTQSKQHPDGWGLGYFADGTPKLFRSIEAAHEDEDFLSTSDLVTSHCVIAHIRKASVGNISVGNTHPFAHGRFLFAHNGTIENFDAVRGPLEGAIAPELRGFLRGDTDSERCFMLFLTHLAEIAPLEQANVEHLAEALWLTVAKVREIAAPFHQKKPALTFLVTDGHAMAAIRDGRTLHFSSHKLQCREPRDCASYPDCETPSSADGKVNHLLVSSEVLSTDDAWVEIPENGLVGIDDSMVLRRWGIEDFTPGRRRKAA